MERARVLVIGDVMRDIIVRPAGPLRHGSDQRAAIRSVPGGSGASQAAWLARFGVPVRFVGCVAAADRPVEAERLRRHGVEPALAGHAVLSTGTLVALVDPTGERSFLTDRGANDGLARADLPPDLLSGVGHLHLSGYAFVGAETRATVLGLLAEARQADIPVSFDAGSTAFIEEIGPAEVLAWTDGAALCIANAAEAEALTGEQDPVRQMDALAARYELAVVKRGPDGAEACAGNGHWSARAPRVEAIDTTGAGDVFLAAFLAARLGGHSIAEALDRGVQAGAHAVTIVGGWPML